MNRALRLWTDRLLRWVYPQEGLCPICRAERIGDQWLCSWCSESLPWVKPPLCMVCGRPVSKEMHSCTDCENTQRLFDAGVGVCVYRGEAKRIVLGLKYRGARWQARWMGEMMGERVRMETEMRPEAVVPVPLHPRKEKTRGYNQAELLAEGLARYLGLPVWQDVLERRVDTPTQTRLGREERLANMRDAFRAKCGEKAAGREILLVDDIMTTGATLEACAACLREAGAVKVNTAVFAISARKTNTQ